MTSLLVNITTIAGTLTAAAVILLRYLIPLYPADGIDPHRVVFHLAVAQYSAVILALLGAAMILWKTESRARKIRIAVLILAIGALSTASILRDYAPQTQRVVTPHPKYQFTQNWIAPHEPLWSKVLSELRGKANIHALEIGSFEGRSALWFLENILTHPTATLTCIDIWVGDYEQRFDENLRIYGQPRKVVKIKGRSEDVLGSIEPRRFDFIYVDGSHEATDVLIDTILAWRLLKPGGYILFDDYDWVGFRSRLVPYYTPKIAVDAFLDVFGPHIDLLHRDSQVVVRKREHVDLDSHKTLRRLLTKIQLWLG